MKKLSTKLISIILILSIIFSFIQVFFLNFESTASSSLSSSYTQYVTSGISSFPESYQNYLAYLKYLHPNWEFKAYYTGISWDEVTSSSAENKCLKNTIYKNSTMDSSLLCICGQSGDTGYYCASAEAVNYYLDPRNFLGEAMIFQFLDLSSGSNVSEDAVYNAVQGTYLEQYIDYIMEAAEEAEINPLHIVATIFQELGKSSTTPAAISGTYSGYEGYYNFYNYGASDGSGATARAMAKAVEMGWSDPETALVEGAKTVLANNYISAGQTTKYFYKFDVVGNEILTEEDGEKTYDSSYFFSHQYMTNLRDPSSQAGSLYDMYVDADILDESLTFIIPVYDDMPEEAVSVPTSLTSSDGTLYYVSTLKNYGVNLRSGPSTSYTSLGNVYKGTIVAVTGTSGSWYKVKVNSVTSYDSSSKTWDYEETTGYISAEYLTLVGTELADYTSLVDMGSSSSDSSSSDSSTTVTGSADFEISDTYVYMTPATTVSNITDVYSEAVIKDSSGTDISSTSDLIGTGATITIDETTYTAIKLGDVNGDGEVDIIDMALIKRQILGTQALEGVYRLAADTDSSDDIDIIDMALVKRQILGTQALTL